MRIVQLIGITGLLLSGWANADSGSSPLSVSLNTDIAGKKVKHRYADSQPESGAVFQADISTVIVGTTVSKGNFFASLNAEQSWKDDVTPFLDSLLFIDRIDYALTAGYAIGHGLSVFTGYKYGETGIVGIAAFGGSTLDLLFIEEGPFVGFSYSRPVSDKGVLALSLAYADMDAETKNQIYAIGLPGTGPASATGDADGLSVGLKWSYEVAETTLLNVGYKINQYDAEGVNVVGYTYSLESDYKFITLGLSHYF